MNRNYLPPSLMPQQLPNSAAEGNAGLSCAAPSAGHGVQLSVHPFFTNCHPGGQPQTQHKQPAITSMVNVMKSATSLDTSGALPTTRRSISFSGGVPTAGHPFQQQYVPMLPPPAPAHNNNQPQTSPGQQPLLAHQNSPAQPIRLGRIERFSRTCKLPTVQEIGKLNRTGSPLSLN